MTKSVFITGGNKGIGLALCKKFAFDYNFKVYMGSRKLQNAIDVLKSLGNPTNIIPITIDVEFENSILKAYQEFLTKKAKNEKLFIFINNAGMADWDSTGAIKTLEMPIEFLDRMFRVNVFSSIITTKIFSPHIENGGRIVNVSGGSGELWHFNAEKDMQVGYASSKLALLMVTKKLSAAVKNNNIYVNAVCPDWCKTDLAGYDATYTPEYGADSVIQACFLDDEKPPTGKYFRRGIRIPTDFEPNEISREYAQLKNSSDKAQSYIEKLVWWIPIRKWRDTFRNKLLGRSDQIRSDQIRSEIVKCYYMNLA